MSKIKTLLPLLIMLLSAPICSGQFYNNEWVGQNGHGKKGVDKAPPPEDFCFKFNMIAGKTLPLTEYIDSMAKSPLLGFECAIEFPSWGAYGWQQYWGKPTIGAAIGFIDMGNHALMGYAITAYPYILIPCVKLPHFEMNVKLGAGVAFMTKRWSKTDTTHAYSHPYNFNNAIGSVVNMYLNAGVDFNFPIVDGVALNLDLGYFHISNGSFMQPNAGLNNLHAQLGLSYTLMKNRLPGTEMYPTKFPRFPYDISLDITAAGGYRENFVFNTKGYGVGMFSVGAAFTLCNWYALGAAAELFYDDTFRNKYDLFRYAITKDDPAQAFRLGLALTNDFRIGRVSILLNWGVYLYDPVKDLYTESSLKYGKHKSPFYRYDIDTEDGWNYFELGLRCRIYDNLYVQIACKTHLQRAEMLTFGLGYSIKWSKNRNPGRNPIYEPLYKIYHPVEVVKEDKRLAKSDNNRSKKVSHRRFRPK